MSLFEVLITGPGYLLAFGIISCPLMWIAEKIDRPRAEGVAIVALFALTAVVVWLVANRLVGISVPLFIVAYRGVSEPNRRSEPNVGLSQHSRRVSEGR